MPEDHDLPLNLVGFSKVVLLALSTALGMD